MKPIKLLVTIPVYKILTIVLLAIVSGASSPVSAQDTPLNVSEAPIGQFYVNTPAVADLDGDGEAEIVVSASGVNRNSSNLASAAIITALRPDLTPLPGWPVQINTGVGPLPPTPPTLADLNGDGRAEVLIGYGHNFYVFKGNGQLLWKRTVGDLFQKRAEVVDLDGDGRPEILAPADHYLGQAKIYIWRSDGEPFTGSPLTLDEFYASSPTIYLQGHHPLMAVGTGNGFASPGGGLYLFAFDGNNGSPRLVWQNSVGQHSIAKPVFTDVQGDGCIDVLGGTYTPSVYAVHSADGNAVPGWPQSVGGNVLTSPTVVEYGGQKLIVAIALDGTLHAWNSQGRPVWTRALPVAPNAIERMEVADVDHDGQPEILLGVNGGVIAVTLQGRILRQWRVGDGDAWVTGVVVVELTPGQPTIVLGSVNNKTEQAKLILFPM